ncbi:MAG: response regulator [Candidatus Omnitrophota bacterium]
MNESSTEQTASQEPAAKPENSLPPFGEGKRVLLVEDDPTSAELVSKILTSTGFEVLTAQNGQEGWDSLKPDTMPHIIVTDFLMPEMDGFSFFKELKKNDETKEIPILVLSARRNTEDSFLAAGADAFHPKPLDTDRFLDQIKKLSYRTPDHSASGEKAENQDDDSEEKKD